MPLADLPLPLRGVFQSGKGILFLGAGIGFNVANAKGERMPVAATLADELAQRFSVDTGGSTNLAKIAQVVEKRHGRPELLAFLSERLSGFDPDNDLRWLICRTWRAIFTTNYDNVIERAFELSSDKLQQPVPNGTS